MVRIIAMLTLCFLFLVSTGVAADEKSKASEFKPKLPKVGTLFQDCKPVKSCNAESGCPSGKGCLQTPVGKFCCKQPPLAGSKWPGDCVEAVCSPASHDGCPRAADDCYMYRRSRLCCGYPPY